MLPGDGAAVPDGGGGPEPSTYEVWRLDSGDRTAVAADVATAAAAGDDRLSQATERDRDRDMLAPPPFDPVEVVGEGSFPPEAGPLVVDAAVEAVWLGEEDVVSGLRLVVWPV